MQSVETLLIGIGSLLFMGVLASKATGRLGVPSLVVFIAIGMLAGSEGIVGFHFDHPSFVRTLGTIALVFILFAGGIDTQWSMIRPVIGQGILLATVAVLITTIVTAYFANLLLGFNRLEGLLLGAIVSSTDAAAVFTVLRARSVSLKGRIKPLLELESGSNDPMAVFLTMAVLLLYEGATPPTALIPMFLQQMLLGAALGYCSGEVTSYLLNRIRLETEGLYPVFTIAMVLLTFGVSQAVGGNGFLAVYICGLVLGQANVIHKKSLILFHDGIAWLMQITMFTILGLQVFPSRLMDVAVPGLILSAALILIARPLAIFATLFGKDFGIREKALISWVGLRGALPIILGTYPLVAGIPRADTIFHIVFFIVLTSVLIQGTSIPFVARLLGVDAPLKRKFRYPIEYVPTGGNLRSDLLEIEVPAHSGAVGKSILELNLPKSALVVLIQRKGDVIVPKGGTLIESGDTMLVLAEKMVAEQLRKLLDAPKEANAGPGDENGQSRQ